MLSFCSLYSTDHASALHAPLNVTWTECSRKWVFKGGFKNGGAGPEAENDRSPDPIQGVLPQVIDATKRVLVSNADWDGLLLTNGTLLSIRKFPCYVPSFEPVSFAYDGTTLD
jgi:carboxypeptidase D